MTPEEKKCKHCEKSFIAESKQQKVCNKCYLNKYKRNKK